MDDVVRASEMKQAAVHVKAMGIHNTSQADYMKRMYVYVRQTPPRAHPPGAAALGGPVGGADAVVRTVVQRPLSAC